MFDKIIPNLSNFTYINFFGIKFLYKGAKTFHEGKLTMKETENIVSFTLRNVFESDSKDLVSDIYYLFTMENWENIKRNILNNDELIEFLGCPVCFEAFIAENDDYYFFWKSTHNNRKCPMCLL